MFLLGYSFVGVVCYLVMVALGEMAAYLPHKKGYATRFVDPAFGFALGWNYLVKYLIVTPNNINAAGAVIQYWTRHIHIVVWMGEFSSTSSQRYSQGSKVVHDSSLHSVQ